MGSGISVAFYKAVTDLLAAKREKELKKIDAEIAKINADKEIAIAEKHDATILELARTLTETNKQNTEAFTAVLAELTANDNKQGENVERGKDEWHGKKVAESQQQLKR
ncbi:MAG: hypothetical protein FWF23_05000 [Alphaproteobacteria bacterium]|nr:hypothetical protein [Alphaproteobacteria bacterium]MCL2505373.1 hypothetical protein [Alphaproteobacteria bacterium]